MTLFAMMFSWEGLYLLINRAAASLQIVYSPQSTNYTNFFQTKVHDTFVAKSLTFYNNRARNKCTPNCA